MAREELTQNHNQATRHYGYVMTFVVILAVCAVAYGVYFYITTSNTLVFEAPESSVSTTTDAQYARSAPTTLKIPKISLETTFVEPLGLNDDQTVEIPDSYTEVGWYKHGATPGEIGPAVVLGHVDSYEGPAVFYNLGRLVPGDEIEVERADGTTAVFVVDKLERVSQNNFPTLQVYGPTGQSVLRLVTCSGSFDRLTQTYSHNLVVYATLKDPVTEEN